jgi:hypothetical protein
VTQKIHETMRVEPATSETLRRLADEYGSKGAVVDAAVAALLMQRAQGRVVPVVATVTHTTSTPRLNRTLAGASETVKELAVEYD